MTSVLVTGGAGFIRSSLAFALKREKSSKTKLVDAISKCWETHRE